VAIQRRPTDDDFQAQLDAIEELASIDNRLRWLTPAHVERFLAERRRAELVRRIEAWNRRFAAESNERRAERGA
jgi:hypothetical protein